MKTLLTTVESLTGDTRMLGNVQRVGLPFGRSKLRLTFSPFVDRSAPCYVRIFYADVVVCNVNFD